MATTLLSRKNEASEHPRAQGVHGKARSPHGLPLHEEHRSFRVRADSLDMEDEVGPGVYIVCQGRVKLLTTSSERKTIIGCWN